MRPRWSVLVVAVALSVTLKFDAQQVEQARFHHVHLNTEDPQRSRQFYQRVFGAMPVQFADRTDALFTGRGFILLTEVDSPQRIWSARSCATSGRPVSMGRVNTSGGCHRGLRCTRR